jgi:hypothetical protein
MLEYTEGRDGCRVYCSFTLHISLRGGYPWITATEKDEADEELRGHEDLPGTERDECTSTCATMWCVVMGPRREAESM